MPQTPIEQSFQDAIGWFRAHDTFNRVYPGYPQPLKGKVAWITNATSGVGKALALRLADAGAKVVLTAQDASSLQEVEEAFTRMGLEVMTLPESDQVPMTIKEEWDALDIVVNCGTATQSSHALEAITDAFGDWNGYGLDVLQKGNAAPSIASRHNWGTFLFDPGKVKQQAAETDPRSAFIHQVHAKIAKAAFNMILKQGKYKAFSARGALASLVMTLGSSPKRPETALAEKALKGDRVLLKLRPKGDLEVSDLVFWLFSQK